jgi:hypothetical protein
LEQIEKKRKRRKGETKEERKQERNRHKQNPSRFPPNTRGSNQLMVLFIEAERAHNTKQLVNKNANPVLNGKKKQQLIFENATLQKATVILLNLGGANSNDNHELI